MTQISLETGGGYTMEHVCILADMIDSKVIQGDL